MATPARPQPPGDPVEIDPKHYTVVFENDRVRVLCIRYGPGEKSGISGHPAVVGVFRSDGIIRFTYPDGKKEDITITAGQVLQFDAPEHDPETLGDKSFEVIAVELKG